MKIGLTARQRVILKSLQIKNKDDNQYLFDKLTVKKLEVAEIEEFCSIINNEFMMEGILPSYEPNEYGLELENLLDTFNRVRIGLKHHERQ